MTTIEIEGKLNTLRELWKKHPADRKIIEVQAKLLKFALEIRSENAPLVIPT